ncbi:MAG TPA: transglutaminase family protein [Candidatus Dormibacteraeota bacterium]|jgi:transglutaminase-like putative cysteine protease|nr:transglutaminase family protein [Candidatus Dormibacteraeota bacterium]
MRVVEPASVDWSSASRASYLVRQTFRYEYPEPIRDLSHRLIVIPPERFGDQRRLWHDVSVGLDGARLANRSDRFGNVIVDVFAPRVPDVIEFVAEVSVERRAAEPNRLADGWLADGYLLEPSRLTAADDRLLRAADDLAEAADWGLELADCINDWVYQSMTYRHGVTGVRTTAAEALALGAGVCQDYAHVMLAICRACGLPSRYVSGHLLGQGGTHAWVEVILPTRDGTGDAIAHAFDPTHASRGGLGYVTVAVGADYADVAPTSGTFRSGSPGRLTASKRVSVVEVG